MLPRKAIRPGFLLVREGDLDFSVPAGIWVHLRSQEVLLSVNPAPSETRESICRHLDTQAAVSREVSRASARPRHVLHRQRTACKTQS
jgi:hypothetical protein